MKKLTKHEWLDADRLGGKQYSILTIIWDLGYTERVAYLMLQALDKALFETLPTSENNVRMPTRPKEAGEQLSIREWAWIIDLGRYTCDREFSITAFIREGFTVRQSFDLFIIYMREVRRLSSKAYTVEPPRELKVNQP